MHRRWLSLPLLSSCVSAFYPYHGLPQGSNNKDKRFIPIHIEGLQSEDPGVYTLDVKKIPTKRDNAFPVVLSSKPSQPNGMAINEDGGDFSYFSTMKFGSKGHQMYMLIDTGSANTWVMGSGCSSNACKIHNTFGSSDSSTFNATKQSWSLSYGTGEVQGVVASDTVAFANFSVKLGFGSATTASDDFNNYPMDGILGLGLPSSNELGTQTIMQVLDQQAGLAQTVIGVHLQRAADQSNDGQITFGGIDTSKFIGKLSYTPITGSGSWEIPAHDAGVNGQTCNFTGKSAIIDTGTSYILMPQVDAQALHNLIPGSTHNGEQYTVPCGTTAQVQFTFSGVTYAVSPKDYVGKASGNVCTSNIIGHQAFGPNQWILGDVFLKNVYTVFDFDKNRIGFGTKSGNAGSGSTDSSPSATNTDSGSSTETSSGSARPSSSMATSTSGSRSNSSMTQSASATSTGGDSSPFGGSSSSSKSAASEGATMPLAFMVLMALIGLLI